MDPYRPSEIKAGEEDILTRPAESQPTAPGASWSPVPGPAAEAPSQGAPNPSAEARHFDLDALRAVLMVLGVFVHGAYVYSVGLPWKVNSPEGSVFFTGLVEAIHAFRMPGFFILSGFFAYMILKRYGAARFLHLRLRRLLIPMLSAAVLLNTLEGYFLHLRDTRGGTGFAAYLISPHYARHWIEGAWVGHLWFLIDVVAYSLALAAAMALFARGFLRRDLAAAALRRIPEKGGLLFLLPLANLGFIFIASLSSMFYVKWAGFLQIKEMLEYLPFFAFGVLLHASPSMMREQLRFRKWHLPVLLAAAMARHALSPHKNSALGEAAILYLSLLIAWVTCVLLFAVFKALMNRPRRAVAYFSEASYSIYLFHHVCIVALGTALLAVDWNIYLEFALITGATLAGTLAIHRYLVMRYAPIRFLFNGK